MNKGERVDKMAETAGLSKSDAEGALNVFIEIIQDAVRERRQGHVAWLRRFLDNRLDPNARRVTCARARR